MTVPREKGGSQPEYYDKAIVTFKVHHGEIYAYAKELGHHDQVVVTGYKMVKRHEGTAHEGTNVAEDRHEGTAHEGSNVAEDRHEALHMRRLLENDDRAFDNYVDHNAPDIDPAADEGEKSDDMAVSDVNSLHSSSCDEVDLRMRKRKRKLPKFEDFRPETDLNNPIFKLGLRFPSVYVFRKAVRNYSVFNRRKIKFSKNDKDKVRAVCDGIKNGKCPWFVYASAVNGSSMVQIKSYEEEHTCGTVERNVHANSSWLAERYATQLSRIINWDIGAFKERVNEDLCVIASRSQIYRARQKATAVSEGTYTKQFESTITKAKEDNTSRQEIKSKSYKTIKAETANHIKG
ncbi:uncharacterized protein Pyn_08297 [Prunus yedoensis var. nudiflora]|uniref:Transposase MuDR plant domain-containing protein n=1 Tax=Prunus yedoensis var. nudiflora TaxID=2094558 RepID=A0A314Z4D2_PRUYE|nr:uncharacterized protein Pyn_08297 [Prunus yedoensis var. nudiflora]